MWPEDLIIQLSNSVMSDNRSGRSDNLLYELNLIKFEANKVTIFVPELLKQARLMHHLGPMVLMQYSATDICVLSHLEIYREVTKSTRKSNKLLLSFVKPHKPIFTSILSRCINNSADWSDIAVFALHLTRPVSTSHCQRKGLSIKLINRAAEW